MTCDTPSTSTISQRPGFVAMAFRPWQLLLDAMAQRRTHAALSALDEHLLKDIGISRSEIAWRCRAANLPYRSGRFSPFASDDTKSK
ncbi:MAG TPA: DUF1127 domain-containing protein [Aestuariivirga sp.]|nr:DUF1127 domain-containing protein [Aestuariivirga sp.]